jgi:hypothetical protein
MWQRNAPLVAAVVNSLVVMLGPALAVLLLPVPGNSVTAYLPGTSVFAAVIKSVLIPAAFMSPFAAVALWRTWVHASQRRERGTTGLQGVAEAGLLGFSIVFVPIFIAVASHLSERPGLTIGYAAFYAGIGLVVGLVFGCVLWVFATIVLAVCGRLTISSP